MKGTGMKGTDEGDGALFRMKGTEPFFRRSRRRVKQPF